MCSGSAEPSIRLAHVLAGQLLKFCDDAICCNAPHTESFTEFKSGLFGSEFFEFNELEHIEVQANA